MLTEIIAELRAESDCRIENQSQALHGALFNTLWGTEMDDIHKNDSRRLFSLSPLYSRQGRIPRRFNSGGNYSFRFASLCNGVTNEWVERLMVSGSIVLQGKNFWITSIETWGSDIMDLDTIDDVEMVLISPLSFRKNPNVDIPVPCPDYLQNHFSLFASITGEDSCTPKLTMLEGKTMPLRFKNHLLIGFVGRMKLSFHKPVIYPLLAHFLGLGHNCAMGMGSTIVKEINAPERIVKLWRKFNWLPEK